MKTIEQAKKEYTKCPNGHRSEYLSFDFSGISVYCEKCKVHYELPFRFSH